MPITRVGAHAARLGHQLGERGLARVLERPLIAARAAADDVADAGEQVAEDVGADDHLAGDDAEIARTG